jgi:hypothetical protein
LGDPATRDLERSGKLTDEDLRTLGIIYRADQKKPEQSLRRVLRIGQVQTMVADELNKLLVGAGFTPQEILKRYNELYVDAKNQSQLSVAKGILDKLADMLDMKPNVTHISAGVQMFDEPDQLPEADWEEIEPEELAAHSE